ncbi:competence type IV pilus minor pilin ComGF [Bacillus sp. B1-b2]|uniref:competence type IV pilus minor pilin ComGF n=1 Tax=Bacillus sp. B1-b2 TaxID=2653201 RepID=UPI001261F23D|nr:competence type IV pilus minor pilin ComGF [Bacillus sp. B1-b2]KAB7670016.1 competence protein comGF [Bacillus sp. B1-b2]
MKICFIRIKLFAKRYIPKINLHYQNEKGYLFMEMLLSLFITVVISLLLSIPLQIIGNQQMLKVELMDMEWEVFYLQLKKETKLAKKVDVSNNKLLLYVDGNVVTYEKYGNIIRRRVNATGHEIALQQVKEVQFLKSNNGFQLSVIDQKNRKKDSTIYSYLNLEGY